MRRPYLFMLAVALPLLGGVAIAADPFEGTWKENAAKSKYVNSPAPKSRSITFTAMKDGIYRWTTDIVEADGKSYHGEYEGKWDGKDIPVKGLAFNSISLNHSGSHSVQWSAKQDGKPFVAGTSVVSTDGKTLTVTFSGKNADGKPYSVTRVLDRQ